MRKAKRVIIAMLAGLMALSMAGCGKMNAGGGETNFPYYWKEESRGTVLIKLDGTYGSGDYRWAVSSTDESVLQVKVAKKEKKGIITYRIKPLKEGSAQIVFVRQREVAEMTGTASEETSSGEGKEDTVTAGEGEAVKEGISMAQAKDAEPDLPAESDREEEDPSVAAEEAEAALAAQRNYEDYLNRFRAKDVIGEIKVRLDAEPTGKKQKLKLKFVLAEIVEHKGVMQSESGENNIDYQVWEDSDGTLQIRLPELGESWSASWEGEYVPVEDPGIPGLTVSRPEMVDGKYIILEIQSEGYIEGANCYSVRGLDQGNAAIKFSNPKWENSLVINIMITKDGKISVLSHSLAGPNG